MNPNAKALDVSDVCGISRAVVYFSIDTTVSSILRRPVQTPGTGLHSHSVKRINTTERGDGDRDGETEWVQRWREERKWEREGGTLFLSDSFRQNLQRSALQPGPFTTCQVPVTTRHRQEFNA